MVGPGGPRAHDLGAAVGSSGRRRRPPGARQRDGGLLTRVLSARFDRRLPLRLASLYAATRVGEVVRIEVAGDRPRDAPSLDDLVVGAGFETVETAELTLDARRALSLPDTVRPRMRVMVCGLNPAVYAAERGVGFARKANRFWPAAVASGLVAPDAAWDARRALLDHGVGMTDLCKRATVASSEVARHEYVAGAARVERLVRWLRPRVIAFVGLEGWRAAINPNATAGLQPHAFGGRPAYVLPSTSGLNAHARLADFTAHLRVVIAIADGAGVGVPPPVHRGRPRPTYTR